MGNSVRLAGVVPLGLDDLEFGNVGSEASTAPRIELCAGVLRLVSLSKTLPEIDQRVRAANGRRLLSGRLRKKKRNVEKCAYKNQQLLAESHLCPFHKQSIE
jgi:hypothetical protein